MTTLHKVKTQLLGPAFTKLMRAKRTNKYRIRKATGISYPTLTNWEFERQWPKDDTAEKVARYLGLIPDDDRVAELEKKQAKIKAELERLR